MPICKYCGDEIEFRYVDGQSTPIHINGGWCTGYGGGSATRSSGPFGSVVSYVNPNARCPVCGETVFFYQSPFGGRVFFDALGWPWPKHGCTDNAQSQKGKIQLLTQTLHKTFRMASGESLQLYRLAELTERSSSIFMKFSRLDQPLVAFKVIISTDALKDNDVTLKDLRHAPSFVVRFYDDYRLIEFISGRKKVIDRMRLPKVSQ
jgi:hypothetical protein